MGISITGHRAQRTWLLIAVAFSAIACREDPFKTFTYGPNVQSVPLPPGVSSDPTQFRSQAKLRGMGPSHTQTRLGDCPGDSLCLVDVRIASLGNTREVNPSGGSAALGPAMGIPVAKIENLDTVHSEAMYGFKPSSQFEYYVWADTSGSQARMTLLQVPVSPTDSVTAVFQKNIQLCLHGPLAPDSSDADFKWCAGLSVSAASKVKRAGMLSMVPLAALFARAAEFVAASVDDATQPAIWLRCTDGCCG
jgi:hypothetical protein